jgi:hypothetical protein
MPVARATAEKKSVEDILQENALKDLNMTDDENTDDGGRPATGNEPDGGVEPNSAPKRGASTATPRGRGGKAGKGNTAARGGRGGKATPRVAASPQRAKATPASRTGEKRNDYGTTAAMSGESVFICLKLGILSRVYLGIR